MDDLISRQAAIDTINGIINNFEQILRDIRESNVDDSVCGMCEYDGAYIGQSGYWCNECPGFDKDDCFKLSDKCKKRWLKTVDLPSAQQWIPCSERLPEEFYVLCCDNHGEMLIANPFECDDSDTGFSAESEDCYMYNCVAWMTLPEPYKGEES